MQLAITGSIATDHLMTFPGRFADSLVPDQLSQLSVSFLVEGLDVRRGGVAANISFGLGLLGLTPKLIGAVGEDFASYRAWLERHGVDCAGVLVSELLHTARFTCTTDATQAQISSFYPGAMSCAREIELAPLAPGAGFDLVVIGPNDPPAMLRHTQECRERGVPFAADPSQQLSYAEGDWIIQLLTGATFLFSNEYEAGLMVQKTGLSSAELTALVGTRVTTLGAQGVRMERAGQPTLEVPAIAGVAVADPTGAGDAFRAGFLAAHSWGLELRECAELGATVASFAVETVGTQEYSLGAGVLRNRLEQHYGLGESLGMRLAAAGLG